MSGSVSTVYDIATMTPGRLLRTMKMLGTLRAYASQEVVDRLIIASGSTLRSPRVPVFWARYTAGNPEKYSPLESSTPMIGMNVVAIRSPMALSGATGLRNAEIGVASNSVRHGAARMSRERDDAARDRQPEDGNGAKQPPTKKVKFSFHAST